MANIIEKPDGLYVESGGYTYRRIGDEWQMLGNTGQWFANELHDSHKRQVSEYLYCLRPYTIEEGPSYPKLPRGKSIGEAIRELQRKELQACTRGIFAPVNLKYDAHAENIARFNREYSKKARGRIISEEEYERAIAPKRRAARWEAVRRARTLRILDSVMAA